MLGVFLLLMTVKVNLAENAAQKEARLSEVEAELVRSRAECSRLSQVFLEYLSSISHLY